MARSRRVGDRGSFASTSSSTSASSSSSSSSSSTASSTSAASSSSLFSIQSTASRSTTVSTSTCTFENEPLEICPFRPLTTTTTTTTYTTFYHDTGETRTHSTISLHPCHLSRSSSLSSASSDPCTSRQTSSPRTQPAQAHILGATLNKSPKRLTLPTKWQRIVAAARQILESVKERTPAKLFDGILDTIAPTFTTCIYFINTLSNNLSIEDPSSFESSSTLDFSHDFTMAETQLTPSETAPLPTLETYLATSEEDISAGVKLIADSLAQQRSLASNAILTHPYVLSFLVISSGVILAYIQPTDYLDVLLAVIIICGVAMAVMTGIKFITQDYIASVEGRNWGEWVAGKENGNDIGEMDVVVSKWKGEMIVASVVSKVLRESEIPAPEGVVVKNKKGSRKVMWIRGWTSRVNVRGRDIGRGVLEEAVRLAFKKGAEDVVIESPGLYDLRVGPAFAQGWIEERRKRVEKAVGRVVEEVSGKRKK